MISMVRSVITGFSNRAGFAVQGGTTILDDRGRSDGPPGFAALALALLITVMAPISVAADVKVVVSIKPVHGLVAGVMAGAGTPALLVSGAASPHTYSLKPSDARSLQEADAIFWIGQELEGFLEKPLANLGARARVVELIHLPGMTYRAFREGGPFAAHGAHEDEHHDHGDAKHDDHEDEHHGHGDAKHDDHENESAHADHDHGLIDSHIWLDPENAKVIVTASAATLARIDPANAPLYHANAAIMLARLETLSTAIAASLQPVRDRPFVVFHDSYQYFEARFGLQAVGSITVNPDVSPGAERVAEIQRRVASLGAVCVFSEPQFTSKLISVVRESTSAKAGVLDPLGAGLSAGPDMYFELLETLASAIRDCLSPQ